MKIFTISVFVLAAAGIGSAQSITEVGPAASYLPTGAPGGGIAQGSFFYVKGSGLGPASPALASLAGDYTLGIELAGTRVRVTILGTTVDAFPYYTSAGQVNAILPSSTPIGSGSVSVIYNAGAPVTFPITVVRAAYGIFTLNSAGSGPAVVTVGPNYEVVTYTRALHPGDVPTLWGTGLGAVTFPDNRPALLQELRSGVSILVGGKEATITYAGRTPGLSGLDQINFVVPQGVTGCGVPLAVRIGTLVSNFATIPIVETGAVCSDPGGISGTDLTNAAASGSITIGVGSLNRVKTRTTAAGQTIDSTQDLGFASFQRFPFNSFIRTSSATALTPGACSVSLFSSQEEPDDVIQPTLLDAGTKLTLTGGGSTKDLTKSNGIYSLIGSSQDIPGLPGGIPGFPTLGPLFLEPGTYTLAGTGGADIGAFSANITIPSPLNWTNQSVTTVPRSSSFTVNWTGGAANDLVMITGGSFNQSSNTGASFVCFANASAGSFQIPSYILTALPASSTIEGTPTGRMQVGGFSPGVRFTATGLNYGVLTYSAMTSVSVTFQ